jgi:hypothetical protein
VWIHADRRQEIEAFSSRHVRDVVESPRASSLANAHSALYEAGAQPLELNTRRSSMWNFPDCEPAGNVYGICVQFRDSQRLSEAVSSALPQSLFCVDCHDRKIVIQVFGWSSSRPA